MTLYRPLSSQRGLALWPLIILLIVIAALAGAGWWGWQQWQILEGQRSGLEQQVAGLEKRLDQQGEESREQRQALAALRHTQEETEARMARDREKLNDMSQGGQRLWLITEAESLASLASQRLLLTGDAEAARRLLKAADETLARLDDPQTLPARRALAADMEALNAALQMDVQALVLRLGALRERVEELAVPLRERPQNSNTGDDNAKPSWWQQFLSHLPVNIRHHDDAEPLPMTQSEAALVRLSINTSLQQAQLALLQGRAESYGQALNQARATITQWFRGDNPATRHLLSALDELDEEAVSQALPDIGGGLAAIRELKRKEGDA
ncbi:uroporphyrinogen-III C-methyltransferase [Alloalcanivorax xenomutans]|uniref:uroporphyrinogen-III C-methyltransferase n=1 Tax=Alloalcanivorax xenomutans TaxID=1094342 RepID=UPI0003B80643|nr:uroporphyrin-III C-methyltransferase [Alcanivorax sp. PN-3]